VAGVADHDDLTEVFLRQRFIDRIVPYLFGHHRPSPTPVLVLVGGQPAAGKTIGIARLTRKTPGADLVVLTGDALRQFHPRAEQLLATDPIAMPNATAAATAAWVRMSIDYAHTHRFSLLLEGTFRDAAAVSNTLRRFAAADFFTDVAVLAVPAERSRLDSMLRYTFTIDGTPGRWTPPTAHDIAYERLPATVAAVEAVRELDRISVITRDGDEIFTNERGPCGGWHDPGRAHQALAAHRARPMPADQAREWLAQYRTLLDNLHQHPSVDPRALSTYARLHNDAAAVLTTALHDLTDSRRGHPLARHHADGILLDDLSPRSAAVAGQPGQPGQGRGFLLLAAAPPPTALPPQFPPALPPASRPKHR
jgi:hypothetical protein